jgi:hypothetical protein
MPGHVAGGEETGFGPFANVPVDLIRSAGFDCPVCKTPVRRFGVVVPHLLPRALIYNCGCGKSIVCWEDELQPSCVEHWRENVELARQVNVEVVVFNGGKETPPDFQSVN